MIFKRLLLTISLIVCTSLSYAAVSISGLNQFSINTNGFSGVGEISGITYVGNVAGYTDKFRFLVVSDNASGEGAQPRVYSMDVTLNMTSGNITSAIIVSQHNLSVGYDLEGIAYNPKNQSIYVSDENSTNSIIREYNLQTGAVIKTLSTPSVFANARDNYGFESVTRQYYGESLWTANEEALTVDGSLSTTSTGSIVRLLKFDSNLNASAQYAYQTDPKGGNLSEQRCGVSDLCVLPDGTLLVLERYLGFNYRSRIYQVNFTGATDISGLGGLIGQTYTKTGKTLLWDHSYGFADQARNYEGLCLGPQLLDGSYSMLTTADYNIGSPSYIYALKATGVTPPAIVHEPSTKLIININRRTIN